VQDVDTDTRLGLDLADRVKIARERRGWSQSELAQRLGMTRPQLCNLEHGQTRNLTAMTLYRLAKALGVSMEWLWTGE